MDQLKSTQREIKRLENLIDDRGKGYVIKKLTESSDPWTTLKDVQANLSLGYDRCNSALCFLDILKSPRSAVFASLLEDMKSRLEASFEKLDEKGLLSMLHVTLKLFAVNELMSIPLAVIKRLNRIPEKYLLYIVVKGFLANVPLSVRRQAWQMDGTSFIGAIDDLCVKLLASDDKMTRQSSDELRQLCDSIGLSEPLLARFADYCVREGERRRDAAWGRVIGMVLMSMQDRGERIISLGRLHDLAWLLDSCHRAGAIDRVKVSDILEALKVMVYAQAAQLEKEAKELGIVSSIVSVKQGMTTKGIVAKRPAQVTSSTNISESDQPVLKKRRMSSSSSVERPKVATSPAKRKGTPLAPLTAAEASEIIEVTLLKPLLRRAWKAITTTDDTSTFANEVTDELASGYSMEIKRPMDLGTMLVRLNKGQYRCLRDFDTDMCLIFANCVQYNGNDSALGKYAKKLYQMWSEIRENILEVIRAHSIPATTTASVASTDDGEKQTQNEQVAVSHLPQPQLHSILRQAWEFVSGLDKNGIFAHKVTDELAPGYSMEIKRPMDLGTMLVRLNKGQYRCLRDFDTDMCLIFANCVQYNGNDSALGKLGNRFAAVWRLEREETEEKLLIAQQPSSSSPSASAGAHVDFFSQRSAAVGSIPAAMSAIIPFDPVFDECTTGNPQMLLKAVHRAAVEHSLNVLVDLDTTGAFSFPNISSAYQKKIRTPMDLSTIRVKVERKLYKDFTFFNEDVELIINNCFHFNKLSSDAYKVGSAFNAEWIQQRAYVAKRISEITGHAIAELAIATGPVPGSQSELESGWDTHAQTETAEDKATDCEVAPLIDGPHEADVSRDSFEEGDAYEMAGKQNNSHQAEEGIYDEEKDDRLGNSDKEYREGEIGMEPLKENEDIGMDEDMGHMRHKDGNEDGIDKVEPMSLPGSDLQPRNQYDAHQSSASSSAASSSSTPVAAGSGLDSVAEPTLNTRANVLPALLQSSLAAKASLQSTAWTSAFNVEASHVSAHLDFPAVRADRRLSWALALLREPRTHDLLTAQLAVRLKQLMTAALSSDAAATVGTKRVARIPSEDRLSRVLLQLCQLGLMLAPLELGVQAVDDMLLRDVLPALMLLVLKANPTEAQTTGKKAEVLTTEKKKVLAVTLVDLIKIPVSPTNVRSFLVNIAILLL